VAAAPPRPPPGGERAANCLEAARTRALTAGGIRDGAEGTEEAALRELRELRELRARRRQFGPLSPFLHHKTATDPALAAAVAALGEREHLVPLYQRRCLFDAEALAEESALLRPFAESVLVLGLHPDQATEPIVDACLRVRKPFAIVPCCVFPEENPQRRTAAGGPVRSHEQFVEYLLAKAPCGEIERGVIEGMPGRNVVLHYRLGSVGWGCPE
jgi:hypothetical protein